MNWTLSRWWTVLGAAALATLAASTLLPIAPGVGWPVNHEGNSFYLRTLLYAEHMKSGDWFPIWSSIDNDGFGSPQPLLYHKLFYLVSGTLYSFIGQMKPSILVSLWFWLMVGAGGTYALCRTLGCRHWLAWCGGAMLLATNYTVTNWLTRGALAEFSAAMLLPWVLRAFMEWLTCETHRYRTNVALGLLIGLVVLAHSVLAYYLVLLLGACALLLMVAGQVPMRRLKPLPLLSAGIAFASIAGPYLAAMYIVGGDYRMSRILPTHYLPENQLKPPMSYIWERGFQWGKVWDHYTIQLDTPLLALLASGLILVMTRRADRATTRGGNHGAAEPADVWALAIIFLLASLLQTSWAIPFYRFIPGAAFIQFPWRLLAVLTPCLIALTAWLWQRQPTWLAAPAIMIGLASMFWLSGAWAPMPLDEQHSRFRLAGHRFSVADEYVPATAKTGMIYDRRNITRLLEQAGCELTSPTIMPAKDEMAELLTQQYHLQCRQAGTYPLPLFGSPLHLVRIDGPNGISSRPCGAVIGNPALCAVDLPEAGSYRVLVEMPTLAGLLGRALDLY